MSGINQFKVLFKEKKTLALAMIVVIFVIAAVTVTLLPMLINAANGRHVKETVNHLALLQAQALENQIAQIQTGLQAQARAADVGVALQQGNTEILQALAEKLRAGNADAVQMYLIPVGADYASFGLRFSQIDRLSKADHGETVYPEAFDENDKGLFDLVVPLKSDAGQGSGYLLAVFNIQLMQKNLEQLSPAMAKTVVFQKFNQGGAQVILPFGLKVSAPKDDALTKTVVPYWQLQVLPGEQLLAEAVVSPFLLFAAQGLVIVVCLLALMMVHKRTHAGIKKTEEQRVTPIQIRSARKVSKLPVVIQENEGVQEESNLLADPLLFRTADTGSVDFSMTELEDLRKVTTNKKSKKDVFAAPSAIFREYDIRGNADKEISDELAQRIGLAFGSECLEQGQQNVFLAGDGRLSTPRLKAAVQEGLLASGCNVVDLGNVPTPLLYFAISTVQRAASGIMVTASHNPAEDNGFKMVVNKRTLASEHVQRIRDRVQSGDFFEGSGEVEQLDIVPAYISHIANDIVLAGSYKVVLDCGNGIAGDVAPQLFEELGCDVVRLYCDVDGSFPNHGPDPSVMDNLADLVKKVKHENADLGIAFDGDGDRLAVVTSSGDIIFPDELLMLFAKDIVSRNPGTDVIYDVKSTRRLNALISSYGGRPVMWKSGHSNIKNKMLETGALLGGEFSGHIFFKERWFGFDDGMYSAARLLEIMSIRDQNLDDIFASFPECAYTPEIRIPVAEEEKFAIVKRLADKGEWGNGKRTLLDGVRVDFAKGWGLVRASNTSAALTLRFEADDVETLATVQHVFKQQLLEADKDLRIPF